MNGEKMNMNAVAKWQCWLMLMMMLCAAAAAEKEASCSAQCSCTDLAVLCRGCPKIFPGATLTNYTEHVLIDGCLEPFDNFSSASNLPRNMIKLSIVNSVINDVAIIESFVSSAQSLVLRNNSIDGFYFKTAMPNITFIDLSFNKICSIQNNSLLNLPNLKYLDISKNQITTMAVECFTGLIKLQHLDLSLNNMTILSNVFSPLISLQHLNLSWNHIELLPEGCFNSLYMLQHLDVSYNRLTSVAPGALQFLPNLARLLLADNPKLGINQLDGQLLVGTGRRLQQVDASRTGLIQVPEALTHSVRFLNLAGNKIATLRCGDLDSYPLLQTLDFTDNVINTIEDDALGRLELLSNLYLPNNNLRTVPKMLPGELTELSLNNNIITNLTITDFINLPNLKILLLAKNNIYFIQENVFIQLFSLQVLDISFNPIKTLTSSTFNGPTSLKELNLSYLEIATPSNDLFFPVSTPEGLERLELQHSPGLALQFLADTAVLAALTRLQYLDLRYTNLTNLRSDLIYYLSQLHSLKLDGNQIDCKDLNWLANWVRDNPNNNYLTKCFYPSTFQREQKTTVSSTKYESRQLSTHQTETNNKDTSGKEKEGINTRSRKYESKNYSKSNILRDTAERSNAKSNNNALKPFKLFYNKPSPKIWRKNETEVGGKNNAAIAVDNGNIRRLIDFFKTFKTAGSSLGYTNVDGNKTIILKHSNREEIITEEEIRNDSSHGENTSEAIVNAGGVSSREPQPFTRRASLSVRETNKTASLRQTPTATSVTNGNFCGPTENGEDTKNKTTCINGRTLLKMEYVLEPNSNTSSESHKQLDKNGINQIDIKNIDQNNQKKVKINNENKHKFQLMLKGQKSTPTTNVMGSNIQDLRYNINISVESIKTELNSSLRKVQIQLKPSNDSKSEWSRYSDERSRSHPGAMVALGVVGLCIGLWVIIHIWGKHRANKSHQRSHEEQEDIEVPTVAAPGGLW